MIPKKSNNARLLALQNRKGVNQIANSKKKGSRDLNVRGRIRMLETLLTITIDAFSSTFIMFEIVRWFKAKSI